MSVARHDRLLGFVYDAPFDQRLWVPAMELLADELGDDSACMTSFDVVTGEGGGVAACVPDGTMDEYMAHWTGDNPLLRVDDPLAYVAGWRLSIIRNEDWMDAERLRRTGFFNDFLRPLRSEHGMMIRLSLTGTVTATMNVARGCAAVRSMMRRPSGRGGGRGIWRARSGWGGRRGSTVRRSARSTGSSRGRRSACSFSTRTAACGG